MTEPGSSGTAWEGQDDPPSPLPEDSLGHHGKGTFMDQLSALIIRNLTLKRRDIRRTLTEFAMPLYFIFILALIRLAIQDDIYESVVVPHGQVPLLSAPLALNGTTLHVAPNVTEVHHIVELVQKLAVNYSSIFDVVYYYTEQDLTNSYQNNMNSMIAAVVFSDDPIKYKTYKLRFNSLSTYGSLIPPATMLWSNGKSCRNVQTIGLQYDDCPPNGYYFSGFSALQMLIDIAVIRLDTKQTVALPNVMLENFPRDESEYNGGMVLRNIVPLYMVFAWAQFILYMMMLVVEEKEKKIKESMKMMGLRDSVYWLSWFTVYGGYVLVLAIICIIVLPLSKVFLHANLFLLFILFILYGCSSIMFSFMLTPFFNNSKVAGIVGSLTQVSLSLLFYLQVYLGDNVEPGVFWALALFSPCAFSLAIDKTIMFDYSKGGLSYDRLWDGPGLPFAGSLIMIFLDIFIYLFLAYYLDNVVPSEYGTKRRPWFIFQKSFWVQTERNFKFVSMNAISSEGYEEDPSVASDVEPVSSQLKKMTAVRIRSLKKTFHSRGKNPVHAVDGFSLDIYEGQITAILGHNGAGKTTLFNILTGMTAPSQGSASVFGMDISDPNDLTELRRITGVCPQHDVIFLTLTPREHLRFFAKIRGVPATRIEAEVEQTLKDVDLYSKKDSKASDLSGGQKRKLSIGIALIGDPKIIFLDEPTAGVDAYSRRKLWGLLKKKKEGKVILLTTHFMDEADILADRKAIMSQGKIRCCGSSLFLKNKFGLGYHLTLVVSENADVDTITRALQTVIMKVQLVRFYGKEMSFVLPTNAATQFPMLFSQLDKRINSPDNHIGIEGYGISMTTLEEVFLTLSEENEGGDLKSIDDLGKQMIQERSPSASSLHQASSQPDRVQNRVVTTNVDSNGFAIDSVEVKRDTWRAFLALLKVRLISFSRELNAVVFLILVPLVFTAASIALADQQAVPLATDKLLNLEPGSYDHLYGALLNNKTQHNLQDIESTFTAANMPVTLYPGNYSYLSENWGHMTAFNVYKFPQLGALEEATLKLGFNDSYMHSIPILVNLLNNAILSSLGGSGSINILTQFLPTFTENAKFDASTFLAPMMIGFTFTLIPTGLAVDLVYDREIKARNLLRLNGVGFNLYFSSFIILMVVLYMVSYVGLLIIIQAYAVPSLVQPAAFGAIAILYFLYMPCALLFSAIVCYIFDKTETARQFYPNMATTLGFVAYTAVSLVDMLVPSTSINSALLTHCIFTIFCPVYIPFGLLYYINKIYIMCSLTGQCDELTAESYMTPEIIILFVVVLVDIPVFYLLLRVVDTIKLGGRWQDALWLNKAKVSSLDMEEDVGVNALSGEDDDVQQERQNVAAALREHHATSPVLIYDLGKVYKKDVDSVQNLCKKKQDKEFVALKSVSMEVKSGQVFGLLGPNGAGKTTSLRIMTAEERPTKGKVQICGEDVLSSISSAFETMGYCPQHDALWKNITVAEHIQTYAEIRGVKKDQVQQLVNIYLKGLEVEEHRDKKSKDCSGGTKRKLSYIISMLGRPQVVLLDEPSTGMDPKSKRFLWNSILASFKGERSAILTTHAMEEADALCSTIGILVRGGMRCIGPIQHLKNKYGGGYSLEMKLRHRPSSVSVSDVNASSSSTPSREDFSYSKNQAQNMIKETFPNAILDEQFEEHLIYKIPQNDVENLANCFEMLEKAKTDELVEEYALSQTTLEQVFLQFARQQEEQDEDGSDD